MKSKIPTRSLTLFVLQLAVFLLSPEREGEELMPRAAAAHGED